MASFSFGPAISIWQAPRPHPLAALACLHAHKHTNIHTVITSPLPLPTHTQCSSHTHKQAWVLGWSENIDLHKSMHCLLLFHHWPLQIHVRLLHIVSAILHAVAHAKANACCTFMHAESQGESLFLVEPSTLFLKAMVLSVTVFLQNQKAARNNSSFRS